MQIPDNVYEKLGLEKPAEEPEKVDNTQLYTRKSKIDAFKDVSIDKPMYADVVIHNTVYNAREDKQIPYSIEGIVAIDGIENVNVEDDYGYTHREDRLNIMILNDNSFNSKHPDKMTPFTKGSGLSCEPDDIQIKSIVERTPELDSKYKKAIDAREYNITGRIYPEVNLKGLDDYNAYIEDIKVQPFETNYTLKGIRSLDDAEKWMLENHPAEFVGCNINSNKGDFMCQCVPSAFVEGDWSNRKNQETAVRDYAHKRFGIECGEFDFSKADIKEPIQIKCKLYGTEYTDTKGYEVKDNKMMKTNALSIDDAKKELLTKHPDYYLGCEMYSGERCVYKNSEPIWNQNTYESRYDIAKTEAKRLGVEAGTSEVLKSKESQASINATIAKGESVADKSSDLQEDFIK